MTRVLSELLGSSQPTFHQVLSRLESASEHNNADIRLSVDIERATKLKLHELGLDPNDTTGKELYEALLQKVNQDDQRLSATLKKKFGEADLNVNLSKALSSLPISKSSFAMQTTVAKKLLKKLPPKRTIKALNYRSFDSMLRQEKIIAVFAAAWLLESASWRQSMLDSYRKLKANDFEIRDIEFITPSSKHWQKLTFQIVNSKRHNIISLREFGAILLLPFPQTRPPAATLASLTLALHEVNEIRASATFLKLCQVRPDFGKLVQTVVTDGPFLATKILDQPVPWQIIQRYYSRFVNRFREDVFEPQVQRQDLSWHSIEKALCQIDPSLTFWEHTSSLGFLYNHQPVSLNVIDAALNYCNQMAFDNRVVLYLRNNLWHELLIRYLKHENVEEAVINNLQSQLVEEPAML